MVSDMFELAHIDKYHLVHLVFDEGVHQILDYRVNIVSVLASKFGAVRGNSVIHDRKNMPPALLPNAVVLKTGNVKLKNLNKRKLLPRLLVYSLQTLGGEVNQLLDVVQVVTQAVEHLLQRL